LIWYESRADNIGMTSSNIVPLVSFVGTTSKQEANRLIQASLMFNNG